jgi:hypothetical protein
MVRKCAHHGAHQPSDSERFTQSFSDVLRWPQRAGHYHFHQLWIEKLTTYRGSNYSSTFLNGPFFWGVVGPDQRRSVESAIPGLTDRRPALSDRDHRCDRPLHLAAACDIRRRLDDDSVSFAGGRISAWRLDDERLRGGDAFKPCGGTAARDRAAGRIASATVGADVSTVGDPV